MLDKTKLKNEYIKFTVLPEDKQRIQNCARLEKLSVSELVRRAVLEYINKGEEKDV